MKTRIIIFLIAFLLTGCGYRLVKQDDYDNLHMEIKRLKEDIKKLQEYTNARNVEQQAILKGMRAELRALYSQLESRMVTLDGKMDASRDDLKMLGKKTESLGSKEYILKKIKTAGDSTSAQKDSIVVVQTRLDIQKLFNIAKKDFTSGQYKLALKGFKEIVDNYGKEPGAAKARFWIGECYYVQKEYKKAAKEYVKTFMNYSSSPAAASALYKTGLAYDRLGNEKKKKQAWKKLLKEHPASEEAIIVKERMK
jgi:tol-pal system protein YbgF